MDGGIRDQDLKPGHPIYERIKREVIDEYEGDEEEVRASIDAFLEDIRQRRLEREAMGAESLEGDDGATNMPALPRPMAEDAG